MLKLVKRKSNKQSSHENIAEPDQERKAESTVKEKGKKTFSFKLKTSPPKEFAETRKARYKDKEKKDPLTLTKGLTIEENKELTVEKYNHRGEKNTAYNSHEESIVLDELYLLRKEVSSLKQQLAENQKKTEELKGQKNQQICALTYKLANAIKQKECAEEEVKLLKDKIEELVLQLEESAAMSQLRKDAKIKVSVDGANKNTRMCMSHRVSDEDFSDVESVKSDDTVLLCTSEDLLLLQKLKAENDKEKTEDQPNVRNSVLSFANCSAPENKDVNLGVTQIQKEIKSVRDNMTIMKGLNKKLFKDLKHFSEFQKDLLTNQSTSKSQQYQRYFEPTSCKKPGSVSSPNTSSTVQENRDQELGGVLTRVPDLLRGSTPALTESAINETSSSKIDKYVQASTKDHEIMKGKTKIFYEDEIKKADERVRQLEDEDESVRQQLKKLIVNMENLRADNTEMKQELRKLSSPSSASSGVLLKRNVFTDKPLYELKQRGQEKPHKSLMAHEHIVEVSIQKETCANPKAAVPRLETIQGQNMITGEQISSQNFGIQRYIVRSSETIASLRDLKPQEIVCFRSY